MTVNVSETIQRMQVLFSQKRYVECEQLCRSVLSCNPDNAEACNVMGILCILHSKPREALYFLNIAFQQYPNSAPLLTNMATCFRMVGNEENAKICVERALSVDKAFFPAKLEHCKQITLVDKSAGLAYMRKLLKEKPESRDIHINIMIAEAMQGNFDNILIFYEKTQIELPSDYPLVNMLAQYYFATRDEEKLEALVIKCEAMRPPLDLLRGWYFLWGLMRYLRDELNATYYLIKANPTRHISAVEDMAERHYKLFLLYLVNVVEFKQSNPQFYTCPSEKDIQRIYVIGESHSLFAAHQYLEKNGTWYHFLADLVMGGKAHSIGAPTHNSYKLFFDMALQRMPDSSTVIFMFGEIDTRINEGIFSYLKKNPEAELSNVAEQTVQQYVEYVTTQCRYKKIRPIFCTTPAPNSVFDDIVAASEQDRSLVVEINQCYNNVLRHHLKSNGIDFIDVYGFTVDDNGFAKANMHMDGSHIDPSHFEGVIDYSLQQGYLKTI